MSVQLAGLDRVIDSMRQPLERLAQLVAELAADHAQSFTIFGRIASAAFDARIHTARSVLVVDHVDLNMLRSLSEKGTAFGKARVAAPLIMTPRYIKASLDTFPLELLEIMHHHITLFGEECFRDLSFDDTHVRLQCERELKVLLIGLRQGLLATAGREKYLGALGQDIGESLIRTLRGMLWLKGKRDPMEPAQILDAMAEIAGSGLSGIRTALDPSAPHGWTEFEALYHDMERLEEITDAG